MILVAARIIIGGSIGLYMFFIPHRDVQKANTYFQLTVSGLVNEYLADRTDAKAFQPEKLSG